MPPMLSPKTLKFTETLVTEHYANHARTRPLELRYLFFIEILMTDQNQPLEFHRIRVP